MQSIDDIDRKLLRYWQNSPDARIQALAEHLGLGMAATARRIEKLRAAGVVGKRRAIVDPVAMNAGVKVFLRITLDKTAANALGEFIETAKKIEAVTVIETLVGRVDVRMDVAARDLPHFQEIYAGEVLALPHIQDIESLLLISEVKNETRVPL